VPESVARENVILPLALERGTLTVVVSDPADQDTIQKLRFILNREIAVVVAPREQIIEAINRHYGPTETESVDSMLREFTDTQIDFTPTEASDLHSTDFELDPAEPATLDSLREKGVWFCASEEETGSLCEAGPEELERQATVRHYHRMNPEKMFP